MERWAVPLILILLYYFAFVLKLLFALVISTCCDDVTILFDSTLIFLIIVYSILAILILFKLLLMCTLECHSVLRVSWKVLLNGFLSIPETFLMLCFFGRCFVFWYLLCFWLLFEMFLTESLSHRLQLLLLHCKIKAYLYICGFV